LFFSCFFSLNYCFAAVVLIATNKVEYILAAEIGLPVWGSPANFNGFRVLAALLHGSQVLSVSQTLRR